MLEMKTLQDLTKYLGKATGASVTSSQVINGEIMINFGYIIPWIALISQNDTTEAVANAYQDLVDAIHSKRYAALLHQHDELRKKCADQEVLLKRYADAQALNRGETLK